MLAARRAPRTACRAAGWASGPPPAAAAAAAPAAENAGGEATPPRPGRASRRTAAPEPTPAAACGCATGAGARYGSLNQDVAAAAPLRSAADAARLGVPQACAALALDGRGLLSEVAAARGHAILGEVAPRAARRAAGYASGAPPAPPADPPAHWLDRFPRLRDYVAAAARRAWADALVRAQCAARPALAGREALLRASFERALAGALSRHAAEGAPRGAPDARAAAHLQAASLAVATREALAPWERDERGISAVAAELGGGRTTPALLQLMRLEALLGADPYAAAVGRLRALRRDYGAAFDAEVVEEGAAAVLVVRGCPYRRIFAAEGAEALLGGVCCSADAAFLAAARRPGVAAALEASGARGDATCRLAVRRVAAA
jgi:hypothetical protein